MRDNWVTFLEAVAVADLTVARVPQEARRRGAAMERERSGLSMAVW